MNTLEMKANRTDLFKRVNRIKRIIKKIDNLTYDNDTDLINALFTIKEVVDTNKYYRLEEIK